MVVVVVVVVVVLVVVVVVVVVVMVYREKEAVVMKKGGKEARMKALNWLASCWEGVMMIGAVWGKRSECCRLSGGCLGTGPCSHPPGGWGGSDGRDYNVVLPSTFSMTDRCFRQCCEAFSAHTALWTTSKMP